jgi:hypothetical protein
MSESPAAETGESPVLEQQAAGVAIPAPTTPPEASEKPPAAPDPERISFQAMADRLTLGLLAAVIGAVLVFVSAFLTWARVDARSAAGHDVGGAIITTSGISGGRLGTETLVLAIMSLVIVGVMLLPATKPWAWQVLLGFGLLIAFFALYDLLSIPGPVRPNGFFCGSGVTCSFHRSIEPGVWFTLIASLLIVAGAYVHHIRPVPFRAPGAAPQPKTVDLTKS